MPRNRITEVAPSCGCRRNHRYSQPNHRTHPNGPGPGPGPDAQETNPFPLIVERLRPEPAVAAAASTKCCLGRVPD